MPPSQLSPRTPSNIPIVAQTPSRASTSGTLPLSFIQSVRRPSFTKGTPSSPSPNTSSGTGAHNTGIPAFRSLRNLLPFGPGKNPAQGTNNAPPPAPKSPFSNFGSMRRSMQVDRRPSTSRSKPEEDIPVISIDHSEFGQTTSQPVEPDVTVTSVENLLPNEPTPSPSPSPSPRTSPVTLSTSASAPPSPVLGGDLSTIIEADTSGISKHQNKSTGSSPNIAALNRLPSSKEPSRRHTLQGDTNLDLLNCSALDLSTSHLDGEVLDAMMEKDFISPEDWLSQADGVVIEEPDSDSLPDSVVVGKRDVRLEDVGNLSFNLSALDPELAQLLSPNNVPRSSDRLHPPPIKISFTPSPSASFSSQSIQEDATMKAPQRYDESSPPVGKPTIPQISPSRKNFPQASLLPRLRTAVAESTPVKHRREKSEGSPSPVTPSHEDEFRHRAPDALTKRQSLSQVPHLAPRSASSSLYASGEESGFRKPTSQTRFTASGRHASAFAALSSKRTNNALVSRWEADSNSPHSRPASSLGADPSDVCPRPSFEADARAREQIADRERALLVRSRKRSLSVDERPRVHSRLRTPPPPITPKASAVERERSEGSMAGPRPTADWLGPRTTKAFAAAGLLDYDRDASPSLVARRGGGGPLSRLNPTERDNRSQYTPSRIGLSEDSGFNSSWGRSGRGESAALMESPTFTSTTTHRTTFSGGSSAPTTVSNVPSVQQQMQTALQTIKEKHDTEMEALLSALSDSQRTSKALRDENGELRARVAALEKQLEDAKRHAQRLYQPAPAPPSIPMVFRALDNGRTPRSRSNSRGTEMVYRYHSHPHVQSLTNLSIAYPSPVDEEESFRAKQPAGLYELSVPTVRRASTASSIFPAPPSNMTMLMQEEGSIVNHSIGGFSRSSPSPPPLSSRPQRRSSNLRNARSYNRSMSVENTSPTTACFTMTEMGSGSPGSLFLRPEHELHLEDMASLDLGRALDDDDEDEVYGHGDEGG